MGRLEGLFDVHDRCAAGTVNRHNLHLDQRLTLDGRRVNPLTGTWVGFNGFTILDLVNSGNIFRVTGESGDVLWVV